jgi:hypothetical protein
MERNIKFTQQIALLNQMKNRNLLSELEYNKVREYMKKKYSIGHYGLSQCSR